MCHEVWGGALGLTRKIFGDAPQRPWPRDVAGQQRDCPYRGLRQPGAELVEELPLHLCPGGQELTSIGRRAAIDHATAHMHTGGAELAGQFNGFQHRHALRGENQEELAAFGIGQQGGETLENVAAGGDDLANALVAVVHRRRVGLITGTLTEVLGGVREPLGAVALA